jgi:hypothetical protein
MVSYLESLSQITPEMREKIEDAFTTMEAEGSALVRRVAENIKRETRLSLAMWSRIFDAIVTVDRSGSSLTDATLFSTSVRRCFSSLLAPATSPQQIPSRTPTGPAIVELSDFTFGRLIPFNQLVSLWVESSRAANHRGPRRSRKEFESWLVSLTELANFSTAKARGGLDDSPLGMYIIWSTFDDAAGVDPFYPRPTKLRDLVSTLGLDEVLLWGNSVANSPPNRRRNPKTCVLLRYRLPPGTTPHVPTVVEAYAGAGIINYYFTVCPYEVDPQAKRFPRTLPAPSAADTRGYPEVVHSVIFANSLSHPLEVETY